MKQTLYYDLLPTVFICLGHPHRRARLPAPHRNLPFLSRLLSIWIACSLVARRDPRFASLQNDVHTGFNRYPNGQVVGSANRSTLMPHRCLEFSRTICIQDLPRPFFEGSKSRKLFICLSRSIIVFLAQIGMYVRHFATFHEL
jgi:hypothetical protein